MVCVGGSRSATGGGIIFYIIGFSKGDKVSAAASVGPGRCPLGTRTPLAPPASGGKQELSCRLGDFAGLGVTHPLPPPVRGMGGGEWLVCAGGGNLFYTSHFKGGGSRLPPRSAMDGRHWRPSPPFGTPVRACLTPILFFFFGLLKGWTRLPHSGRCHRRAMTERASSKFRRAKPRGIFLSSPATGRKNRGCAGVKFLQTKIPAGKAQRNFLVLPGLTSQVSLRSTCSKAERAELALCPFRLKKEIYEKETCTRVNWKNRSSRRGPG